MASNAFSVVHAKHLPSFWKICGLLFGCAMPDPAYRRTMSYPKIDLFLAIKCIKLLPSSLSLCTFVFVRIWCWWCGWRTTSFLIRKMLIWKIWNVQDFMTCASLFSWTWFFMIVESTIQASTWFLSISILSGPLSASHFSMEQMTVGLCYILST